MSIYSKILDHKNSKNLSYTKLGEVISKSGDAMRMAVKRKSLSDLEIERLEQYFDQSEQKVVSSPSISDKGVPYYDVDFHGGFDPVFNDQTMRPNFYIDFPPYNECDAWINVTGKSMSPFISHGDIAALKKLSGWREFMPFGEVYAVYTTEHRTIKIVTAGKDEDHLTLIPYNKGREFVEQQIPKNIIREMFRVYGSIKKFF